MQRFVVLWNKHTVYFADLGQAEVGYFYSYRREHRATEVWPSINMNSALKQRYFDTKGFDTFRGYTNWSVKGPDMAEQWLHRRELCSSRCTHVCLITQDIQPCGLNICLPSSSTFCLWLCCVLDQLLGLARPASTAVLLWNCFWVINLMK